VGWDYLNEKNYDFIKTGKKSRCNPNDPLVLEKWIILNTISSFGVDHLIIKKKEIQ